MFSAFIFSLIMILFLAFALSMKMLFKGEKSVEKSCCSSMPDCKTNIHCSTGSHCSGCGLNTGK